MSAVDPSLATTIASWFIGGLGAYLVLGALVAAIAHFGGLRRIDAGAADASLAFRVLVTPGIVALWPLLLGRLWRGDGQRPVERNAHRVTS